MTNRFKRAARAVAPTALCFALAVFAGCSDDGGSSPAGGGSNPLSLEGTVTKGPIDGASVDLYQFTAFGGQGSHVAGPFVTAANGSWAGEVPAGTTGPLLIMSSGGVYTDEATSQTVAIPLATNLYGILQLGEGVGNATPVTHAIVKNVQARIANGASLATAVADAIGALTTALGYDPTATDATPPPGVSPATGTPTPDYTVLLAGVSQMLSTPPTGFSNADVWDMVMGVAEDLSSGTLDGLDASGAQVMVDPGNGSPIAWPSSGASGIDALVSAANQWAASNSYGTIATPDLGDFSDVTTGGGGGGASGQVSITDAVTATFSPTNVLIVGPVYSWTDATVNSMSVTIVAGVATGVLYYNASLAKQWIASGDEQNPVQGVFVNGNTVFFEGAQCFATDQSRVILNGSLSY